MIGELIAELRKDLRLKQTDVAAYLGVSAGTISNYECGRYEPDLGTVRQLSKLFNVTSDYLLGLTDNKYTTLQLKRAFGSHSTLEDCLSVLQRLNKVDQNALEIVLQTFKATPQNTQKERPCGKIPPGRAYIRHSISAAAALI